jgi:hypothetical protein
MLTEVIGHRLAEIRRTRSLTQQQIADRMGVSKGRVSQIERGKISGRKFWPATPPPSAADSTKPSTSTTATTTTAKSQAGR